MTIASTVPVVFHCQSSVNEGKPWDLVQNEHLTETKKSTPTLQGDV